MMHFLRTISSLSLVQIIALVGTFLLAGSVMWATGGDTELPLLNRVLACYFLSWGAYTLISTTPRHEIRVRFLLATASVLLCVALLEVPALVGVVDYRKLFSTPGYPNWWNAPGYIEDNELVYRHEPNYRWKGEYLRGNIAEGLCGPDHRRTYDVELDDNGFRNDTTLSSADIAIIGDSFVDSPMTERSKLLTTVLHRLENKTVVNLGTSGYGPQQELIVLKRYALPLQPKTIVWIFYEGNDLQDSLSYARDIARMVGPSTKRSIPDIWHQSFTRNLLSLITRVKHGCKPSNDVTDFFAVVNDGGGQERKLFFFSDYYGTISQYQEDYALSMLRSVLTMAYQLCQKHGIRFIVAFAPTEFRVYNGLPNVIRVSDKAQHWQVNDLPQQVRLAVEAISPQIDYVDLTEIFKDRTKNGYSMFLRDDTHWTDEGHLVAAHAIHETLRRARPLVAQSNKRFSNSSWSQDSAGAMMVRDLDGKIRYWSGAAGNLYGWDKGEALGKTSHQLLETRFPAPLDVIEARLKAYGSWEGRLVHKRRDGTKITVKSRWEVQKSGNAEPPTVVEINLPVHS